MKPEYLGDGAYVRPGRYVGEVMILADHHEPERASNVVYLDPNAVRALRRWLMEAKDESAD